MDMFAICGKLSVICAMYDMWAGRRSCYGPEGVVMRTGRSGPGKAYVCKCILGNSLIIYAYSCYVCVSGTSEDRGKAPA